MTLKRQIILTLARIVFGVDLFFVTVIIGQAYVASSSHYWLQSDSVNFGGGLSTSSSYKVESTLGEMGSGTSTDTVVNLRAGYQAMQLDTYVSLSVPESITLTPSLNGVGGGVANGSGELTVVTNNAAGYALTVSVATSPALKSSNDSLANYQLSEADPDFSWSTPATESRFGFSPEGGDVVAKYLDNGVACHEGAEETADKCWNGFGLTGETVASHFGPNDPDGDMTTLKLRAQVGANHIQQQGNYSANLIITAIAL